MRHLRKFTFAQKNQYFRTIGPSMAPLELLLKRQAVVLKAPGAYIGLPPVHIGLEPLSAQKRFHVFFVFGSPSNKKIWIVFFLADSGSRPI